MTDLEDVEDPLAVRAWDALMEMADRKAGRELGDAEFTLEIVSVQIDVVVHREGG
jgi:hypothetical protein